MEWIYLARDRVKWRVLASTTMNLPVARDRERLSGLLASEGEQGQQWLSTLQCPRHFGRAQHVLYCHRRAGNLRKMAHLRDVRTTASSVLVVLAGHETSHSKALPASPMLPTAVTQDVGRYIASTKMTVSIVLMMEEVSASETSLKFDQTRRRNIPRRQSVDTLSKNDLSQYKLRLTCAPLVATGS